MMILWKMSYIISLLNGGFGISLTPLIYCDCSSLKPIPAVVAIGPIRDHLLAGSADGLDECVRAHPRLGNQARAICCM